MPASVSGAAADTAPAVDAATRTQAWVPRNATDSAPAADVPTHGLVFAPRSVADSAPTVESLTRIGGKARTVGDSAPATDVVSMLRFYPRVVLDQAPAADVAMSAVTSRGSSLDLLSNLGSALVVGGGQTTPPAGTVETFTVMDPLNIPPADSTAAPPTQFRIVDQASTLIAVAVLTAPLMSGTTYTALAVSALPEAVIAGDRLVIGSGPGALVAQVSTPANAGDTSIAIAPLVIPNFPVGVIVAAGTMVAASSSPFGEIMIVTNVFQPPQGGAHWTVVRGAEGTTPRAHPPNWTALCVATTGALSGVPGGGGALLARTGGDMVGPIRMHGQQIVSAAAPVRTVFRDTVMSSDDSLVQADATTGPISLTLPSSPGVGQSYTVIKTDGTQNPVILLGVVNDQTNLVLTAPFDFAVLTWDGTEWVAVTDVRFARLDGRPWLDPRAFGAIGDGAHDDTPAARACYAVAGLAGYNVQWSAGVPGQFYKLNGAVTVLSHTHTAMGPGVVVQQFANAPIFTGTALTDVWFQGGELIGFGVNSTSSVGVINITYSTNVKVVDVTVHENHTGIWLLGCTKVWVERCEVYDFFQFGVIVSQCVDFHVDRNIIHDCLMVFGGGGVGQLQASCYGVQATGDAAHGHTQQRCSINFNHIYNVPAWDGIMLHESQDCEIIGNTCVNVRNGIDLGPFANANTIGTLIVVGNILIGTNTDVFLQTVGMLTANGSTSVTITSGTWSSFSGALPVSGPGIAAGTTISYVDATHGTLSVAAGAAAGAGSGTVQYAGQNDGIQVVNAGNTTNVDHVVVADNLVTNFCLFHSASGYGGIVLQAADNVSVTGNTIWSCGTGPVAPNDRGCGIKLNTSAHNVSITGNTIRDCGIAGVYLYNGTFVGVSVVGNAMESTLGIMVDGIVADSTNAIDCAVGPNTVHGCTSFHNTDGQFHGPIPLSDYGPSTQPYHDPISPAGARQLLPLPAGRVNQFRLDTTVQLAHASGAGTSFTLAATVGIAPNDRVYMLMDNGNLNPMTVASVVDATHITTTADLPAGRSVAVGAGVNVVRWTGANQVSMRKITASGQGNLAGDGLVQFVVTVGTTFYLTVPTLAPGPGASGLLTLKNDASSSANVQVFTNSGTIDGGASLTLTPGQAVTVFSDGVNVLKTGPVG